MLFCHHCLTPLKPFSGIFPRTIPCTQCARVLYCSEHCRTQSWQSYHRFDCLVLANFDSKLFAQFSPLYLALRTLFVAGGLESIRAVTQKVKATEGDPSKSADFTHSPMHCYENVYRMAMKKDDSIEDQIYTVIRVISLFKWLAAFGDADIFEGSQGIDPLEKDIYAIETLLRHYQQNRCNPSLFVRTDHSTMRFVPIDSESILTLDPVISLVRKSCDPNISIISVDCANRPPHVSNVSVFFAVKPMAAGTLLTCVGPSYGDSMKLGFYLDDFVRCRQRSWNEPGYLCSCEHCEGKRRKSPFGFITNHSTALDGYELCCGSACGGLIRRTDDDTHQVKCCTCKRDIGPDELAKLKKISLDISKMHSKAIASIARINTLIKNNKNKMEENLSKELTTALVKLETLINDCIAPLALKHCRLILVDLYKQLVTLYRYCNDLDKPTRSNLAYLHKAWKYAEASHTTLLIHFGGNSLGLLRLLQENVGNFSIEIVQAEHWLMNWMDYCHYCMNEKSSGPDKKRVKLTRLVGSFYKAMARLDRMKDCYNFI